MRKKILLFVGLLALLTTVWILWEPILIHFWPSARHDDLPSRGQFGDSYGGLNTLFTGWAFAGLGFTIYLQLLEARARDQERREQETERTKGEEQRLLDKFEDRYFRLSDVLRAHVLNLEIGNGSGKAALSVLLERQHINEGDRDTSIAGALRRYKREYNQFKNVFGPYFRILYRIIKYVDQAPIKNKTDYTGITRAELGNTELWLIALNGLTEEGANFKPLIIEYGLLKHFAARGPHWDEVEANIRTAYPKKAFSD